MRVALWLALPCVLLLGAACGNDDATAPATSRDDDRPLRVQVVNYPLQYFAERIGGEHADVVLPVPAGQDPAVWTPGRDDIRTAQQADLILCNGAGYATWVAQATLAPSKIVVTAAAARDRFITVTDRVVHKHGPAGAQSDAGTASHVWLDPTLAVVQVEAARDAFIRLRPQHKAAFESNAQALVDDLLALDKEIEQAVAGNRELPLFERGTTFAYLAKRYRLNLSRSPTPGATGLVLSTPAETHDPSAVVLDPCYSAPAEGDYLVVMKRNVEALRAAFER